MRRLAVVAPPSGDDRRGAEVRLCLGVAALIVSGLPVRTQTISPAETAVFRAVNRLPDQMYAPIWVVMQAGSLGAVPAAAAVALITGRPRLAVRLTVAGLSTWAAAKLIKKVYRRPRPQRLVRDAHCRGPEQSGLGYVSGHAGVASVLGVASFSQLHGATRGAVALAIPTVSLGRMYVGAHLPLDVLGGAALGLAVDAAVALSLQARHRDAAG